MLLRYHHNVICIAESYLLLLILLVFAPLSFANNKIILIYPDAALPYKHIFNDVVEGIENQLGSKIEVEKLQIRKTDNENALGTRLKEVGNTQIIVLGKRTLKMVSNLTNSQNITYGLMLSPLSDDAIGRGILLTPDPVAFSKKLDKILPPIKNIYFLYSTKHSSHFEKKGYKDLFSEAGHNYTPIPITSLKDAINKYSELIKTIKKDDVIWLPPDPITSSDKYILPILLKSAWRKGIIIVSSNPSHAKNGILLSLHPDNKALGSKLAQLAMSNNPINKIYYLNDFISSANLITARHLNIDLNKSNIDNQY